MVSTTVGTMVRVAGQVPRVRRVEADVQRILRGQDGVITRAQALEAGLSSDGLKARVRSGQWARPLRGVYVVGGMADTAHRSIRMAIAAASPGAVASHGSAAWLWGMSDRPPATPVVSVLAPRHPVVPGVDVHRTEAPFERARQRGLPCTPAARTLIDCAATTTPGDLAELVDRSLALRVVHVAELTGPPGGPRLRGRGPLRQCLEDRGMIGGPAPSVLESRMARLFRRHRLPVPRAEVVWGDRRQYRLDFAYPSLRLMVEVDGYAWHASPEQFARDHRRRNELTAAGWMILTYTWQDVTREPDRVAAEIARAHCDRSATGVRR
jgi:very-short-patch-repair endonuclease